MGRRRIEIFHYRQVLVRLRAGESERDIARSGLMGRQEVAAFHHLAQAQGCLDASQVPEEAASAAAIRQARRAASTGSHRGVRALARVHPGAVAAQAQRHGPLPGPGGQARRGLFPVMLFLSLVGEIADWFLHAN